MSALNEIRGRLEAATPGPWDEWWRGHIYSKATTKGICQTFGPEDRRQPDAEFIAHAPEDIRRLLNAVEAVLALHYECEESEEILPMSCVDGPCEHDDLCPEVTIKPCVECSTPGEVYYEWPCPTVKAITSALEAS